MINDFIVKSDFVRYINLQGMKKASNKCMKLTMQYDNMGFTLVHPLLRKYNKKLLNTTVLFVRPAASAWVAL